MKLCARCERDESEVRELAQLDYAALLARLADPLSDPASIAPELAAAAKVARLGSARQKELNLQQARALVDEAVASDAPDSRLSERLTALRLDTAEQASLLRDFEPRRLVADALAGRLPTLARCSVVLRAQEAAHYETEASLLEEFVDRQWQSGSHGYSIRIARGLTYRWGQTRGQSVAVGRHVESVDRGPLTVTSRRVVFTGGRQSIEMLYSRLLSVDAFDDGVRLNLANRKTPPVFEVAPGSGQVIAALVSAAAAPRS